MKTLTLVALQLFLVNLQTNNPELLIGTLFEDLDFINEDDEIGYYTMETNNWEHINSEIFSFNLKEQTFTYNPDHSGYLNQITEFSNWISRSYEDETYPWEENAWTIGYCRRDDDVNSNSSYLDILIEAIKLYEKHNK